MFLITFLEEAFGPSTGTSGDTEYGSLPKYLEETRGEVPHIWPLDYFFLPVARPANAREHVRACCPFVSLGSQPPA